MKATKGILGVIGLLAFQTTFGEASQAPSSVKNRIEMFESLSKGGGQNKTDWTAPYLKDEKNVWERRGLFIEGLNVFDEQEHQEHIFVVNSPEGKLLGYGYEDTLQSTYEKLKPGQKVRAFLEVVEESMSESSVKEINKVPPGYYADPSNRSSGLYTSKVIHIKGTHRKLSGKNVFYFKSTETNKFIELKYANPAMANTLKPNQPLDAYIQLRENPNESVVVSMDYPPEMYLTLAVMKSQKRPATSAEMVKELAKNGHSLGDFLEDEKNRNVKLQEKHIIDVQYAQIQKELLDIEKNAEFNNELVYQILLQYNALLTLSMKSEHANKFEPLLIKYYGDLSSFVEGMAQSPKDKALIHILVKNYKELYAKLKALKEDAAKNEMVKIIFEKHQEITDRFVDKIKSNTTNKGTSHTAEGYPNFITLLIEYYTLLRLAVIKAR